LGKSTSRLDAVGPGRRRRRVSPLGVWCKFLPVISDESSQCGSYAVRSGTTIFTVLGLVVRAG
jgi:hypothetical protein